MSGSLWACLLWFVGASDVVSVCGCWLLWTLVTTLVTMGVATPCRFLMASGTVCMHLMSKVGVASLCGLVFCGLWVPLMWSVCVGAGYSGRWLPWAWRPLAGYLMAVCMHLMSKVGVATPSGCVCCGLWVPLMWSVCGRELPRALQPLAGVYCLKGCVWLTSKVGVAALCGCVSCGLWVPLMWSMCGGGLLWALQPLAGDYWPNWPV